MGNQQAKIAPGRPWADAPFKLLETPRKIASESRVRLAFPENFVNAI